MANKTFLTLFFLFSHIFIASVYGISFLSRRNSSKIHSELEKIEQSDFGMQVIEIIGLYFDSHAPLLEIAAFLNDLEEGLELQLKVETNIMKNQKEICENITGIIDNMVIILNEDIDKSNRKIIQLEKEFESIKEEKSRLQEEIDEKNKKLAEKELEIIKCNNWRVKYLDFTKNSNEKSFIIKEIQLLLISKPDIFSDYFHSKAF